MASSLGGQTRPGTDNPDRHSTARTGEIGARQYNRLQMLRFLTAGESHGPQLTVIVEGLPAGVSLDAARDIDPDLRRRQGGHGRGKRQQIEHDTARIVSGVRHTPLIHRIRFDILRILPLRRGRRAESRNLDDFMAEMHVRQAKTPADEAAIAKQAPDLFRQGVGGHVEILRRDAQEQVADRPTDQKPLITRLLEAVEDFQGVRRDRCT